MARYNRYLLMLWLTGSIAIFIGASQKLGDNPNYSYAIMAGLFINLFAVSCFVYYNRNDVKLIVSRLFVSK